jgi:ABC-type transport system involved in multi-copper enzyme maturation permease subunit
MIRHIIRKEVLENLLSLRFVLSLIAISSLFGASGLMFVGKYRQDLDDYWKETNRNFSTLNECSKRLLNLIAHKHVIWRKPKAISFSVEGFEKSLPDCFTFDIHSIDLPEVGGRTSFLLPNFSDMDWAFIISIFFSFLALVFTYDSICGEKQAGTLRLISASSIARHQTLLGKYFGVMLVLAIPLLLGFLINLIIIISSGIAETSAADWIRIFGIVFLSYLYLSLFVLLGIFISTRSAHPASSIVVLLLIWVALVILLPSLGRIAADRYDKSSAQIPTNPRLKLSRHSTGTEANAQSQKLKEYVYRMIAQAQTGRHFTGVSPAVVFQRATEAIAGTGIHRIDNLFQQIKTYHQNFREYVQAKDAEDPDSDHSIFEMSLFDIRYKAAMSEEEIKSQWPGISLPFKSVDFDSVPKFQERDLALGQSLKLAIWDIGLLMLFNLVFFAASCVSFLRYDVR